MAVRLAGKKKIKKDKERRKQQRRGTLRSTRRIVCAGVEISKRVYLVNVP